MLSLVKFRADRALPPSGFAKIFGDKAISPSNLTAQAEACVKKKPLSVWATHPFAGAHFLPRQPGKSSMLTTIRACGSRAHPG